MRYAAKIDLTQPEIVDAYRSVGAQVIHIRNPFDLLVLHRGKLFMVDPKTPRSAKGTIRKKKSQQQLEDAGWPLHYPRSVGEALAIIGVKSSRGSAQP